MNYKINFMHNGEVKYVEIADRKKAEYFIHSNKENILEAVRTVFEDKITSMSNGVLCFEYDNMATEYLYDPQLLGSYFIDLLYRRSAALGKAMESQLVEA